MKKLGTFLVLIGILVSASLVGVLDERKVFGQTSPENGPGSSPRASEVTGNEFYAEQISVRVTGSRARIRQSMFTNDSNIFQGIDFNDPAFNEASFFLSASNGKSSSLSPHVHSSDLMTQAAAIQNSFMGFLYFNPDVDDDDVPWKARRALSILRNTLGMDLILVNFSRNYDTHYIPFMGFYPDWAGYVDTLVSDLPTDGYWRAFDDARVLAPAYMNNHLLQTSLILLDHADVLEDIINATQLFDQSIGEMLNSTGLVSGDLDLSSFLDIESIIEDSLGDLNDTIPGMEDVLEEVINSTLGDTMSLIESMSGMELDPNALVPPRLVMFTIEYDANPAGITEISPNVYSFDLRGALDYQHPTLEPSRKIYIALIGALFSGIDFTVQSAEITWNAPNFFEFSSYLIERIELLVFLGDIGGFTGDQAIDLSPLYDYNFRGAWETYGETSRFYCNLHEKQVTEDEFDFADQLYTFGIMGVPQIPLGLLDGIANFQFMYNVTTQEPIVEVVKTMDMASNPVVADPVDWEITVRNNGLVPVYGITPDAPPQDFLQEMATFAGVSIPTWESTLDLLPDDLINDMLIYFNYASVEELTGTQDARVFMLDENSDGTIDQYAPNVMNAAQDLPYNPIVADWLRSPEAVEVTGMDSFILNSFAPLFDNPDSIYNPENWRLDPGESLTFTGATNMAPFDSYSSFQEANITINSDPFPYLTRGTTIAPTSPANALTYDENYWVLDSDQVGAQNLTRVIFHFQNHSVLENLRTLDRLQFHYTGYTAPQAGAISWDLYNWDTGTWVPQPAWVTNAQDPTTFTMNTVTDPAPFLKEDENYTLYLRMTLESTNASRVYVDALNVSFQQRDITGINMGAASFIYSGCAGLDRYHQKSNDIVLGTIDFPSLVANGSVTNINCTTGDLNQYTLDVRNVGSRPARNVNLTLLLPGIVVNPGNFQVDANFAKVTIPTIAAGATWQGAFTFKVANGLLIPGAFVDWEYDEYDLHPGQSDFNTTSNEVYFTAPVDYKTVNSTPYLHSVRIATHLNNTAPRVTDDVLVNFTIHNTGLEQIKNLELLWPYEIDGFNLTTNGADIQTGPIAPGQSVSIARVITKASYRGYFFPALMIRGGDEFLLLEQDLGDPVAIGVMNLSLHKTITHDQPTVSDHVRIVVNVTNNGTIVMGDLVIDDSYSYDQRAFALVSGRLIHQIGEIQPGESISFNYTLRARSRGEYTIRPAQVHYYYQFSQMAYSNTINTKIRDPMGLLVLWILLPTGIGFLVLGVFVYMIRRYNIEELEQRRREELMFGQSLTEKMWEKQNAAEYLEKLLKDERRAQHQGGNVA